MPKGLHLRAKDDHLEGQVEATYTRGPTISSRGDRNIIHIQGIIFLQSSLLNFCFAVLSIPGLNCLRYRILMILTIWNTTLPLGTQWALPSKLMNELIKILNN